MEPDISYRHRSILFLFTIHISCTSLIDRPGLYLGVPTSWVLKKLQTYSLIISSLGLSTFNLKSHLPDLINAGSRFSIWLVVIINTVPCLYKAPSMQFNSPLKVILSTRLVL